MNSNIKSMDKLFRLEFGRRPFSKWFIRGFTLSVLSLVCNFSAHASLCVLNHQDSDKGTKIEPALSWTRNSGDGVNGVVKLVPAGASSDLFRLVTISFGEDNWTVREPDAKPAVNPRVDALFPVPANLALGLIGAALVVPRAWKWRRWLR
jgi:hypothetical protein